MTHTQTHTHKHTHTDTQIFYSYLSAEQQAALVHAKFMLLLYPLLKKNITVHLPALFAVLALVL